MNKAEKAAWIARIERLDQWERMDLVERLDEEAVAKAHVTSTLSYRISDYCCERDDYVPGVSEARFMARCQRRGIDPLIMLDVAQ